MTQYLDNNSDSRFEHASKQMYWVFCYFCTQSGIVYEVGDLLP